MLRKWFMFFNLRTSNPKKNTTNVSETSVFAYKTTNFYKAEEQNLNFLNNPLHIMVFMYSPPAEFYGLFAYPKKSDPNPRILRILHTMFKAK